MSHRFNRNVLHVGSDYSASPWATIADERLG